GTPGRSQLSRLIACIEDEDGQLSALRRALQQLFDLLDGDQIHVVIGLESTDLPRSCPTVMREADLGNPMVGPACYNRLSGRVTGRMMVKGAFGTGFRVTTSPDTGIDRVDRLACFQRMLGQECLDGFAIDPSIDQRVIDATPATLK